MKYLNVLPLAGLAVAGTWSDAKEPAKETAASSTWEDYPAEVTVTSSITGTYCEKSHKYTKPAFDGSCTIDVTTITKGATATETKYVTVTKEGGKGETVTVTKDGAEKTVTVTEGGKDCPAPTDGPGKPPGKCVVDDKKAKEIVENFSTLLEFTDYDGSRGGLPGRGYKQEVSDATLAVDFVDISDSINFMAGFPLGSVTFPNKAAFDFGQGKQQPEVGVETLNIWHDCSTITWRWKITPKMPGALPVVGINYFQINKDGLAQKNYAEFNNGAWLQDYGQKCALESSPPSVVEGGEWALKR